MPRLSVPMSVRDHAKGPPDAKLTLVEYGDIQCPHCALAHPVVSEIANELRDSLRVVFRHFPLTMVHPHSQHAAEAAEIAACQGRFWDLLDILYANYEELDDESLARYAKKARVDMKLFVKEWGSQTHKDRVRADFLSGVRSGVNGTPTFFINGERYNGPPEFDALVAALLKASKSG